MRYLILGLIGYLLLVLEGALLRWLPVEAAAPDLALLLVVAVALSRRGSLVSQGLLALGLGYVADVLGGAPRGLCAATFVIVLLATRALSRGVLVASVLGEAMAGLCAAGGGTLVAALLARLSGLDAEGLARAVPAQALGGALCGPIAFAICRTLDRGLGLERRGLGTR